MLAKKGKKLLALLLALIMVLSLLPMTVFAAGYPDQVVSNGQEVTTEDGKVIQSKTIEQTGVDTFNITLMVKTLEEIEEQTVSQDAAVVLVLDASNSMNDKVSGSKKITQARSAAQAFVEALTENAGEGSRMVSVVEFGSNAKTVLDWTNANGNLDAVKDGIDNVQVNFGYATGGCAIAGAHTHSEWEHQQVTVTITPDQLVYSKGFMGMGKGWYCPECWTKVSKGKEKPTWNHECTKWDYVEVETDYEGPHGQHTAYDRGGTNIEGGLRLANNLLKDQAVSGIENTYVVLLSDGVPTYYVSDSNETDSTTFMQGSEGGGDDASHQDYHDIYCTKDEKHHTPHGDNVPQQIKNQGAKLYTVAYDLADGYYTVNNMGAKQWLTAFSTQMISADSDIFDGLGQVAEIIINQAKAWILTDPMGELINYVPDEDSGVFVGTTDELADSDAVLKFNTDAKTLTWDLKSDTIHREKQGNYWVYEFTYSIKLDTAAEGFDETKDYATNGTTTLTYMLTEDGELQSELLETELVVPVVEGTRPQVGYTIEYYKMDRTTGEYPAEPNNTTSGTAKLWTTVTAPEGYETKYSEDGYHFSYGQTALLLTENGMVMRLYYDLTPANVIVNHYVVTTNKTDGGDVVTGPTKVNADWYPNGYWKGDSFTNESFLNKDVYTLVDSVVGADGETYTTDAYENVTLNGGTTVINLYYTAEGEDQRTPVDYEIHYWYREDTWELNDDGKYELVTGEYKEDTNAKVTGKGYAGDTVTALEKDRQDTYTLDSEETGAMTLTLSKDGTNALNVYYYRTPDAPEAQTATLTIEHKYWEQTVNGLVAVAADNWTEYDQKTVYVGETWYATPNTKDGYTLKTSADDFTATIQESGKNYTIVVEYVKDVRGEPVEIVINHHYTTYTWKAVSEGVYEYVETESHSSEGVGPTTGPHYAGEVYTPEQMALGYAYVSGGDAQTLTAGTNTFNLYYAIYVGEAGDEADITVTHHYVTYRSYVDSDGQVHINEPEDNTETEETVYGLIGDSFTAVKNEKDGFTFVSADTTNLQATLVGPDGQYNIYYAKYEDELGDPLTVTVNPVYKTYTMSIDQETGETVTTLTETDSTQTVTLGEDYYAGQKAIAMVEGYTKPGFAFAAEDADNTADQTILVSAEGENVITIVYSRVVDGRGTPVVVNVNNVYTTETKYVANGAVKTSVDTFESANTTYGPYYLNQFFETEGKGTQLDGYVLDANKTQPEARVQITEDGMTVTFYWYRAVDQTVPATVQVIHHYTLKDANPNVGDTTWVVGDTDAPLTGYYAGQYYVAPYNFQDGAFTAENVTDVIPDDAVTAPGTTLVSGENVIHIYYEKSVDSRENDCSVKVVHNYYRTEEDTTPEGSYTETIGSLTEADSYTATLREENNGLVYGFVSADPEGYTITVDEDAEKNVITIRYVRADASYQVVHAYYTNGTLTGTVESGLIAGKLGDVVTAADLTKQTTYDGNSYNYTSADKDTLTLTADGENVITLRYDRTTGGGTVTPTPDPTPVEPTDPTDPPEEEIEDEDPPLADLPEEGTEIEDEEPPLADLPEETIDDEEPPMADAPKTGDNLGLWMTTASLSGLGLVALGVNQITTGRKKKDENQ